MVRETFASLNRSASLLSVILSTLVLLATLAAAWGRVDARISSLEARLVRAEDAIRDHHEDTERHVDSAWKEDVKIQLREIRGLIVEHMTSPAPRPAAGR